MIFRIIKFLTVTLIVNISNNHMIFFHCKIKLDNKCVNEHYPDNTNKNKDIKNPKNKKMKISMTC